MAALFDVTCCHPRRWSIEDDDEETIIIKEHDTTLQIIRNADNSEPTKSVEEVATESKRRIKEEREALGWTLDSSVRGVVIMGTAVFVSSELLRLAKEAAGCSDEPEEICEGRVYGMKPTSILTNIMAIVGLLSAVLMPLIGSIIDHTTYRRAVGRISGGLMTLFILIQVLLLPKHWFAASIVQIFVAFSYMVHLTVVYAYLPELTTSSERLVHYTSQFIAAQYASSVLFLIFMVAMLSVAPNQLLDHYASVDFSQSLIVVVCILFLGYAWTFLFRKRPASQHVPEGTNLLTAGIYKILQSSRTIMLHHSAIKWFLISVAFTEAATYTFSTIAITYMTDQLNFTSRENGICILILLLFGVPGTRIAAHLNKVNPIWSLQACLIVWIVTTVLAAITMKDEGHQGLAYIFAMFWGLCLGWIHPTEKTLYCTIIPRGQEAELMGSYICASQILAWMPSLVFSIMNEAGISMRVGFSSLTLYFIASFFILFMVGDYEAAVKHARSFDRTKPFLTDRDSTSDHHQPNNPRKRSEVDFVMLSDYEEAMAHRQSIYTSSDSDTSSTFPDSQCQLGCNQPMPLTSIDL